MRIAWRLAGPRSAGLAALCALLAAVPGAARAAAPSTIVPPPGGSNCAPVPISVSGPGTVEYDHGVIGLPPGQACPAYIPGATVTLVAIADAGATFVGWSGACQGTGLCDVTVGSGTPVTATFAWLATLSVSRTGSGGGLVRSSPAGIECGATCSAAVAEGTTLSLTAQADARSRFAGWVGGPCDGSLLPCQIAVTGLTTVTARFDQDPPTGAPPVTTSAPPPTCATDRSPCPPGTLRLAAATAPVAHGHATIVLSCDGPGGCDEHLVLTVALERRAHGALVRERVLAGRAHVVLADGERQAVHIRIARGVRALLAQRSRLRGTLAGPGRAWAVRIASA